MLQRTHALHTFTCTSLPQQRINLKNVYEKKSRMHLCYFFFLHINLLLLFSPSFFSSPILLAPFSLLTNPRTNSAGAQFFFLTMLRQYDSRLGFSFRVLVRVRFMVRVRIRVSVMVRVRVLG